jgi:antitoxin HicB
MSYSKTSNQQLKSLEAYLGVKYPITLCPEDDGGYSALVPDLKGCMTQGETIEEALEHIEEARQSWIKTAYDFGDIIPKPSNQNAWVH